MVEYRRTASAHPTMRWVIAIDSPKRPRDQASLFDFDCALGQKSPQLLNRCRANVRALQVELPQLGKPAELSSCCVGELGFLEHQSFQSVKTVQPGELLDFLIGCLGVEIDVIDL